MMLYDYIPLIIINIFIIEKCMIIIIQILLLLNLLLLTIVSCPMVSYIFYKLLIFISNKSIKNIFICNYILVIIIKTLY